MRCGETRVWRVDIEVWKEGMGSEESGWGGRRYVCLQEENGGREEVWLVRNRKVSREGVNVCVCVDCWCILAVWQPLYLPGWWSARLPLDSPPMPGISTGEGGYRRPIDQIVHLPGLLPPFFRTARMYT